MSRSEKLECLQSWPTVSPFENIWHIIKQHIQCSGTALKGNGLKISFIYPHRDLELPYRLVMFFFHSLIFSLVWAFSNLLFILIKITSSYRIDFMSGLRRRPSKKKQKQKTVHRSLTIHSPFVMTLWLNSCFFSSQTKWIIFYTWVA